MRDSKAVLRTMAAVALVVAGGLACPALAATSGVGDADAASLPSDVRAFIERRDQCDHFRGEDPTDDKRFEEIASALDRYCKGTDAELKKLKDAYKDNARVQKALSGYEPDIE